MEKPSVCAIYSDLLWPHRKAFFDMKLVWGRRVISCVDLRFSQPHIAVGKLCVNCSSFNSSGDKKGESPSCLTIRLKFLKVELDPWRHWVTSDRWKMCVYFKVLLFFLHWSIKIKSQPSKPCDWDSKRIRFQLLPWVLKLNIFFSILVYSWLRSGSASGRWFLLWSSAWWLPSKPSADSRGCWN